VAIEMDVDRRKRTERKNEKTEEDMDNTERRMI